MQLYIGNKNYSSWSMRAWLVLRQAGIAFEEVRLRLDWNDDSDFKRRLLAIAPTGRVPLLVDAGFPVWDTLAIAEYVAERCPDRGLWPADAKARARARSLCAEMHAGFGALRERFPMNIEADLPEVGARLHAEDAAARRDLERIDSMWREQVAASGGPFLFGAFGIADAFYAPIATRTLTYTLPLAPASAAYRQRLLDVPAVREWTDGARAEHDFIAVDEPYRSRR